jgi:hypothetical protein
VRSGKHLAAPLEQALSKDSRHEPSPNPTLPIAAYSSTLPYCMAHCTRICAPVYRAVLFLAYCALYAKKPCMMRGRRLLKRREVLATTPRQISYRAELGSEGGGACAPGIPQIATRRWGFGMGKPT